MNLNNLNCLDLDQPQLEGFKQFLSAWLYRGGKFTFLVDPGPLSTIPLLLAELRRKDIKRIDYILLTHIHIDHAGGTGELLKNYPEALVICHPEGVKHLVDPEQLWLGSLKVLGRMAEVYGEIIPVPAEKIVFAEEVGNTGIQVFKTPGHAQHHLCFLLDDVLFAGEVVGVRSPAKSGIYMRPATPPRFLLDVAQTSIDNMLELKPRYLVMAHYGLVEPALEYLQIGRRQLDLWVEGVGQIIGVGQRPDKNHEEKLFNWLLERDSNYRRIHELAPDIYARERYFLGNTMRGMSAYLKEDRR
ncbi:MAG TPA: MBL fold metallo-hydrolase [Proteobacteria bacterium]|nr:MBL fold metallo-hydrolase [Pseudomonadota bacterium]